MDMDAYKNYSKLYLSITFAFDYGLSFATLTATISHVFLFHGKYVSFDSTIYDYVLLMQFL
jgi:hypothetical protein